MVVSINNSIVLNTACFCPPTNGGPLPKTACVGSQRAVTVYDSAVHRDVCCEHDIYEISMVVYLVGKPIELTGIFNGVITLIFIAKLRIMGIAYLLCRLIGITNGTEPIIIAM